MRTHKLLAVLAHPDDESLGFGGTLARYAAAGVEVSLVTATRGEAGRYLGRRPGEDGHPGPDALASMRESELRAGAEALGIGDVTVLDYRDQELDQADPRLAVAAIAHHIRRIRPDVIVTFGLDGAYGHPDHIAVSQFTSAAVMMAASPAAPDSAHESHGVSKLYHLAWPERTFSAYQTVFGALRSVTDGAERTAVPCRDWEVTTQIDTTTVTTTVLEAVSCHTSQVAMRERLQTVSREQLEAMWGRQSFRRVFSLVNGGRRIETDLFEGIDRA